MFKQRFDLSHFEKISAMIVAKVKNFFNPDTDFSKSAREFEQKVGTNKPIAVEKLNQEKKRLNFMLNVYRGARERWEDLEKMSGVLEKAEKKGQEHLNDKEQKEFQKLLSDLSYAQNIFAHGTDKIVDFINSNTTMHDRMINTFLPTIFAHIHRFNKFGKKIFMLEKSITEELYLTEISHIDDAFLQLPFPEICLYIPHNNALYALKELIRWIYVSEEGETGNKKIKILCITEKESNYMQEFVFCGGDIKEQLKKQIKEKYESSKLAKEEITELFDFIMATLLYINGENADFTQVLPKVIFPKKDSRLPMCSVGRNIVINKDLSGIGISADGEKNEHTIHILKWTVRGHFRKQRVGEGRSLVKTIWIRPFLKGKERENDVMPVNKKDYVIN